MKNASKPNTKWCAYGQPGYDIQTGKPYQLQHPCQNPARPGHICCDSCRVREGGMPL